GLEPDLVLGLALGILLGAKLLFLALAADIDDGLAARLLVGLLRALHGAGAHGDLLGGQRARHDDGTAGAGRGGRRRGCGSGFLAGAGWRLGRLAGARHDALLAHLDHHGLGAAMREALTDLARLHRLAQFEASARSCQGERPLLFLFVVIRHLDPVPSFALRRRRCCRPRPISNSPAAARNPASRAASLSSALARRPGPTTAWTTCSRPNAAPSSAAVSTSTSGNAGAATRTFSRPPSPPSAAASSTAA